MPAWVQFRVVEEATHQLLRSWQEFKPLMQLAIRIWQADHRP